MYTRREFKNRIRTEETRSCFAEIRNNLMLMVLNNEIDANSILFKKLYQAITFIMRSPDKYKEISDMLTVKLLTVSDEPTSSFQGEELELIKNNEKIKNIISKLAKSFELLIIGYSLIRRTIFHIEYHTGILSRLLRLSLYILKYLAECEEKRKPEIATFGGVQKSLQAML